ncbi:MAG: hypothetical protein JXP34_04870 [Planctomycetes bacterium]|nr:hypothetical protein [Planctomycetota bacterium]
MGRLSRWFALAALAAILACRGAPRFAGEIVETTGDLLLSGPEPGEIPEDMQLILWENSWFDGDVVRELGSDFDAILDLDGLRPAPGSATPAAGP